MTVDATEPAEIRWKNYVMVRGATFDSFWAEHCSQPNRRLLVIAGRGFDPRTTFGLQKISSAASQTPFDILALDLEDDGAAASTEQKERAEHNAKVLDLLAAGRGAIVTKSVRFRSEDGRRVAARNAANVVNSEKEIENYTDVVVDISATPPVVYFPLISRLLFFHDQLRATNGKAPNLHVVVSEDPLLDALIREEGIEETASFLHPFEGPFNREAKSERPTVWIPVLGESRTTQFDRIYDLVKPVEVCPVLPSPSRNPRRGDDIVMEYQNLLFDQIRIDPRNIIYSSEYNPFEVYRQVIRTAMHYHRVLGLIGGCRIALSALCSKLMSLGIVLVAYEMKASRVDVGIAHIECQGYEIPDGANVDTEQVGLWIAGECDEP